MTLAKIFVPRDSAAIAAGADDVAQAIADEAQRRGISVHILRNSSRGLFWLEPLVEVEAVHDAQSPNAQTNGPQKPKERLAYGPVSAADVPSLFAANFLSADVPTPNIPSPSSHPKPHPLALGAIEKIPFLAKQERLTFARMGRTDPLSLSDYEANEGFAGLRQAVKLSLESTAQITQQILDSGLRGRGGAAFPAGIKWKTVAGATAAQKYVVCNADEGDSGTYSDRMVMEGDPYILIEGMAIASLAVGATQGYVYIRSEYPHAIATMQEAVKRATQAGWLGSNMAGSGRAFHLHIRKAAGSYVCGEETAMLESLEGKRGLVRAKPPLPALHGLFGQPTLIQNVITLASVPLILARGAAFYRDYGVGRSRGTLPFQLAGNIKFGGLIEKAFGLTLRELLFDFGGGTRSGRPIKAVQVGGPLGAYVPESLWDLPLDYETYAAKGVTLGHGGIVVHDDSADMLALARYAMQFCAIESCGKCTPCRIGSTRGVEVLARIQHNKEPAKQAQSHPQSQSQSQSKTPLQEQVQLLRSLCDTMTHGSLCAMGSMTPNPVLSALEHYPQDFGL